MKLKNWNEIKKKFPWKKTVHKKSKIKNAYWPIAAKMATSTQFPKYDVLTPHKN